MATFLAVVVSVLSMGFIISPVWGKGCSDWPYSAGEVQAEDTPAGAKFLATGAAVLDFDDVEEVLEATEEARMEAKAVLSKFFNETNQSDTAIETQTKKMVKMQSKGKKKFRQANKEKIQNTLKRVKNSSRSLLRGVVQLGQCLDKGQKVMVTVGLKPETIAQAEAGVGAISDSMATQPGAGSASGGTGPSGSSGTSSGASGGSGLRGVDSFDRGRDKMKNF